MADELEAVRAGKHEVENQRLVMAHVKLTQRSGAVVGRIDVNVFALQKPANQELNREVVIDDENRRL